MMKTLMLIEEFFINYYQINKIINVTKSYIEKYYTSEHIHWGV